MKYSWNIEAEEVTTYFGLNLDECFDELYFEFEKIQDGVREHTIAIKSGNIGDASIELSERLQDFFKKHMYKSDNYGTKLEDEI